MTRVWLFVVLGYLSGSVLFARVLAGLMGKDILTTSKDENPGTSNAFRYGGFACGAGTLLGDFIKGFLPVWLFLRGGDAFPRLALALVVAALELVMLVVPVVEFLVLQVLEMTQVRLVLKPEEELLIMIVEAVLVRLDKAVPVVGKEKL